jgi:hypothetical protein
MVTHTFIINGQPLEGTISVERTGDNIVYRFEIDFPPVNLPPENELIFNTEKLTYEPKYPNHKENVQGNEEPETDNR